MAVKWDRLKKTKYPGVYKDANSGRYRIRFQIRDPKTGQERGSSRWTNAGTLDEAVAERARIVEEARKAASGPGVGRKRRTLSDFAKLWLIQKQNEGLRENSLRQFLTALERYILPFLGDIYVDALSPMDIRQWQISVGELRKPGGGRYSQWTIAGWVAVLRNILRDVVVEFGLQVNPAIGLKKVNKPKSPKANRHLNLAQLRRFLQLVEKWHAEHYAITLVLAIYGLRWGEVSALHVEHLDEDAMELRVVQSHTKGTVTRTKTDTHKYLPLDPGVLLVIKDHHNWMLASENPGAQRGLLFPGRFGDYRLPGSCCKAWEKVCKAMGLGWNVTAHDLRRTFQNMLRQAGVGLTVQQALMGHSSTQMTEHYSQVGRDEKRQALDNVVALVSYRQEEA